VSYLMEGNDCLARSPPRMLKATKVLHKNDDEQPVVVTLGSRESYIGT
jgi:hypothetical protein